MHAAVCIIFFLSLSQFYPDISYIFPTNVMTGTDTATSSYALERLNIIPDTIAISGFSSGGAFSTQFHVAFSQKVDISIVSSFVSAALDIRRGRVRWPPLPHGLGAVRARPPGRGCQASGGGADRPAGEPRRGQRLHLARREGLRRAFRSVK